MAALARHVVASSVLFNAALALGAVLDVLVAGSPVLEPSVYSVRALDALMPLLSACEADLEAALALDLA